MARGERNMSSKAAARRKKKAAQGQQAPQAATTPETTPTATSARETTRPTPERMALGKWIKPQGADKRSQPMVDCASDMLGRLYESGSLTSEQEHSGRKFQEIYAAYKVEIGIVETKSCLAGGVGGYEAGDGNEEVYKEYYAIRDKVGRVKIALLQSECSKLAHEKPYDLTSLKTALDCISR